MSDKSAPRTTTTGQPIDVDEEKAKVDEAVRKKVKEVVEKIGEVVRKAHGPPGTP